LFIYNFLNKKKCIFFSSVPGVGNVAPAATGIANTGNAGVATLGANLPHVDPNNFPGTVHWGPEQTVSAAQIPFAQLGAGFGTGPK